MGNSCSWIANIIYYAQKLSYCIALLAVTSCLLVTIVVTLGVGIGMGYHYAVVEHKTHEFKQMANTSGGASNSSRRNDILFFRRKAPLSSANITEEEIPIERHRTHRRRRRNDFKLNSSHLISRLPDLFKLTTIRTTHNLSTTFTTLTTENLLPKYMNTAKKMTNLSQSSTSETKNIRLKIMTHTNKKILSKEMEFTGTGYYYGKSKDEFQKTVQKQKRLHFLNSLIQIYQKPNSSSSTHL